MWKDFPTDTNTIYSRCVMNGSYGARPGMPLENLRGVEYLMGSLNIIKSVQLKMLCGSKNYIEGSIEMVVGYDNVICNKTNVIDDSISSDESEEDAGNLKSTEVNDEPARDCDTSVYALNSFIYQCRDLYGRGNVVAKCVNNYGIENRVFDCERNSGDSNSFFGTVGENTGENNRFRVMPKKEEGKASGRIGSEEAEKAYDGPESIDSWWAIELEECELVQDIKRQADISGMRYGKE